MSGGDVRRRARQEVFLLSKIRVGVFVWRLSEAGVILRDGRVFRSHWATQKATLGRCWRNKTATWGESWTQTSGYPFPQHLFRSLSPFLCLSVFFSSSAWNRITFNWRTLSYGGGGGQRATKKTWLFQQRDTQGWIEREKKIFRAYDAEEVQEKRNVSSCNRSVTFHQFWNVFVGHWKYFWTLDLWLFFLHFREFQTYQRISHFVIYKSRTNIQSESRWCI